SKFGVDPARRWWLPEGADDLDEALAALEDVDAPFFASDEAMALRNRPRVDDAIEPPAGVGDTSFDPAEFEMGDAGIAPRGTDAADTWQPREIATEGDIADAIADYLEANPYRTFDAPHVEQSLLEWGRQNLAAGEPERFLAWIKSLDPVEQDFAIYQAGYDKAAARWIREGKPGPVVSRVPMADAPASAIDEVLDMLNTGEAQPRLPGDVGDVRPREVATPEFEDVLDLLDTGET